jgi:hypothetical protein
MAFELDHVFVCVSAGGGPEADYLAGLGLTEGPPNVHPGQGTACRRFLFANAYLELFWVTDPEEVRAEPARRLKLWERWSGRGAGVCPFGVCVRPTRPEVVGLPFPSWEYRPAYLPAPLCIHVAECSSYPNRPLLFFLPWCRQPGADTPAHAAGFREVSRVVVRGPVQPSPVPAAAVAFAAAERHLLEIGFDGEGVGRSADLRPLLPVVFRW